MPKVAVKVLTQRRVETAKPKLKRYGIPDGTVSGQRLLVQPSGEKSFGIKVRVHGQQVWITIGDATVLSLADARVKGKEILAAAARGEDPRAAKQEARRVAADTVEAVARDYITRHVEKNLRSKRQVRHRIEREFIPYWGKRPIASITKRDVIARLDAIMDRGTPGMAVAAHAIGRGLFSWAVDRDIIAVSPFYRVKVPAPTGKRERTHTDAELRLIWTAALSLGYPWGTFFRLAMLTGQRKEEIAEMPWSELDAEWTVWSLPSARTKNKKPHDVSITPLVRHILATVPRIKGCDYVLTTSGSGPISDVYMAKRMIDAEVTRLNGGVPIPKWVTHDFRRSLASGMAALGVQVVVADKILNHTGGVLRGVTGTYQRHAFSDERKRALELWSRHILTLAGGSLPPAETTKVSQKVGYLFPPATPPKPPPRGGRLLSADAVQKLQPGPGGKERIVRDGGAPGLGLIVRRGGRKDWTLVRARSNGRWARTTLGSADTLSPKEARAMAHRMANEPPPA